MIKKIAIVPYVTNGRNSQVGHFNIFKKKRSTVLKENLQSVIKAKNWEAEVIVDVNHGDLQSLKRGVKHIQCLSPAKKWDDAGNGI